MVYLSIAAIMDRRLRATYARSRRRGWIRWLNQIMKSAAPAPGNSLVIPGRGAWSIWNKPVKPDKNLIQEADQSGIGLRFWFVADNRSY